MQCKQCHTEISIEVAGETTRNIKRYCEVAGMTPEAATSFASQRGPLCRECMQQWDQREDDEESPPSNKVKPR
jgi:hypothetical protein